MTNKQKPKRQKTLWIPPSPLRYEAHKIQFAIRRLDEAIESSPQKVSFREYMLLLSRFSEISKQLNKEADEKKLKAKPNTTDIDEPPPPSLMDRPRVPKEIFEVDE